MTTKLINDNTEAFYKISVLYFSHGDEEDSLKYVICIIIREDYNICMWKSQP